MGKVLTVSTEELLARRAEIVAELGTSIEDLLERGRAGALRDDEWDVWTEICELQYLLGDEIPTTG